MVKSTLDMLAECLRCGAPEGQARTPITKGKGWAVCVDCAADILEDYDKIGRRNLQAIVDGYLAAAK